MGTLTQNTAPVDRGEQASGEQAEELPGERRDLVDAQRHAALPGRKGVGQDSRRVAGEHGPAEGLDDAPPDQPQHTGGTPERVEGQRQGREGEDGETRVVHPDPAVHVAEPAE
jgi:hypothetical protein